MNRYLLFLIPILVIIIYVSQNYLDKDSDQLCKGSAACFYAKVDKIIDGDTIDVYGKRIRLALVDTPERGEYLYEEAKEFTSKLCPIGSEVLIDEDDKQLEGSYGRMLAKVYCSDKILNAELIANGLAVINERFCSKSEFADEYWAKGC